MARIRTVQPQLGQDRKLAAVSREARYTFVLTWTIADDAGLFRADPRQILGQLYPYDPDVDESQLEVWLAELVKIGVVRWHQTRDGARVGEVVTWKRHQKIDKPSKSFLATQLELLDEQSGSGRGGGATDSRGPSEGVAEPHPPESRVLSPESRVLSSESLATLRARLSAAYHEVLDGYLHGAQFPSALVAAILAEGPDTGTNAAAGKTWDVIGRALLEMRAAGKPFTPALLRAFCRRLVESGDTGRGRTPAERMGALAAEEERRSATKAPA